MDLGEKLFEVISNWRRRQINGDRQVFQYELNECDRALALIVQPLFEEPVEIHASKQGGVVGMSFFLPPKIGFFKDRERNRALYIHQILMMAGAQKMELYWPQNLAIGPERNTYFSQKKEQISNTLSEFYPGFRDFQQVLIQDFQALLGPNSDPWLLWGGLSSGPGIKKSNMGGVTSRERSKQKSQPKLATSFEREEVDLDKEQHNPVMHSFEKMETADEYEGGSRTADGSDQLREHSEALKELKLKKVTRSGDAAAAFLNSDMQSTSEGVFEPDRALAAAKEVFYYPEWHFKKKKYQPNHCRLIASVADFVAENGMLPDLRETLLTTHRSVIAKHKQQLLQICNQRKWRGQQAEGSEIDIDAYVRHLSDIRNKVPSSGHFYQSQFLRARDFQVLVLVDLSLSTDSYVANRRVLDVELESVGLIGLLAESTRDNTLVAGTFSETRHHCVFEILKRPQEEWSAFYKRTPGVVPRGYTRLAPAIRHATQILEQSGAKDKILLILTDGKPTDYDGYEGRYGIDDIHKACLEAHARNVMTKAFAIEEAARHYFPQMFGSFEVLTSPEKLPQSLVKVFFEVQSR
jgi:nitric oxide reductase NorD protein